jgi:arginyl-tRNA synthetase
MYRMLEKEAIKSLENAIKILNYGKPSQITVEEPPNSNLGDLATAISFQLAGPLKKPPIELAGKIVEVLKVPEIFRKVESKGPYINFFLDHDKFSKLVLESVHEDYGMLASKNKKIIIEHTSANPNGPLHIGHIRNAIIGDSLARILRSAGYDVETQYYVNDMGRQIAMIVWGILQGYRMNRGMKLDHEIGKIYLKVNQKLGANPQLKGKIDGLIKRYEEGEPELSGIFEEMVGKCLEGIETTSRKLNISHDKFVWESRFIRDGSVSEVLDSLKIYTDINEVLYLNLQNYGIEKELVLTRSDGTSLYSTRDIAYHLEKSKNADVLVNVLGSDHKLAVKQIKIVLEILGGKSPNVIFYEFITLPEGSMSTRKGLFISVDELLEEAVHRAFQEIKKRNPDLDDLYTIETAEKIGVGAIRYYIARLSPEKHIVFIWDDALSFEKGCASIQYAHARACKLLEKAGELPGLNPSKEDWGLDNPLEIELVKTISKFTSRIQESAEINRVHNLAQYAQDLANAFNKFYKSVPVIGSDEEASRLVLVDKSRITIRNCLELLGIEAPVSM